MAVVLPVISRRGLFGGLLALAAPAIIRTPGLLMPISVQRRRVVLELGYDIHREVVAYDRYLVDWNDLRPALDNLTFSAGCFDGAVPMEHVEDRRVLLDRLREQEKKIAAHFGRGVT